VVREMKARACGDGGVDATVEVKSGAESCTAEVSDESEQR
jgi:hypothetical protein